MKPDTAFLRALAREREKLKRKRITALECSQYQDFLFRQVVAIIQEAVECIVSYIAKRFGQHDFGEYASRFVDFKAELDEKLAKEPIEDVIKQLDELGKKYDVDVTFTRYKMEALANEPESSETKSDS